MVSRRQLLLDPYWRVSAVLALGAAVLAAACAADGSPIAATSLIAASLTIAAAMTLSVALWGLPPEAGPSSDDDDTGGGGRGRDPDPDPDVPDAPAGGHVDWQRFEREFRAYAAGSRTHA